MLEAVLQSRNNFQSLMNAFLIMVLFYAGVCLGMQLAVCEFARNVLGWVGE